MCRNLVAKPGAKLDFAPTRDAQGATLANPRHTGT